MKDELRIHARKLRDKIITAQSGFLLRDNFLKNIELPPASTISAYWPIGSEIDVRPLMLSLYNEGHNICLPAVETENAPLTFREWEPEAVMVKSSKYKMFEPCRQHHETVTPSVLIAPLLAFDNARHRLGYGGGYYDRTIEKLRKDGNSITVIGVAYNEQEIEKIPAEDWDVKLDRIVTESKVY